MPLWGTPSLCKTKISILGDDNAGLSVGKAQMVFIRLTQHISTLTG